MQNICYICAEKFEDNHAKDKKSRRVRDHCQNTKEYRDAAHSLYNLKYSIRKETSIVFDNDLTITITLS